MKNLIEEIENKIEELKNELGDLEYDRETRIEIETYKYILSILNQYNIITAPKTIKLSEVVSRLEKQLKIELHIERDEDLGFGICCKCREYDGDLYYPRLVELNENMQIKMILLPQSYYKWLYTLWIAGTEIIDDLESDE